MTKSEVIEYFNKEYFSLVCETVEVNETIPKGSSVELIKDSATAIALVLCMEGKHKGLIYSARYMESGLIVITIELGDLEWRLAIGYYNEEQHQLYLDYSVGVQGKSECIAVSLQQHRNPVADFITSVGKG